MPQPGTTWTWKGPDAASRVQDVLRAPYTELDNRDQQKIIGFVLQINVPRFPIIARTESGNQKQNRNGARRQPKHGLFDEWTSHRAPPFACASFREALTKSVPDQLDSSSSTVGIYLQLQYLPAQQNGCSTRRRPVLWFRESRQFKHPSHNAKLRKTEH